ncbi:MAG: DUF1926 domain-containing protein [Endomicrobium sp.]|jgi:alpha-amylase|nr:DUF1926 domain-containing protein [Endomicrobium sp.]
MSKVKFVFCTHNHQPVGNFDWVFERAYQVSYRPFMNVMLNHPKIKWSMHASGMLWEYFAREHLDYIKNIKSLVASGNLELLSGGYYEPLMSSIPDRDKIGQINKMTCYIKDKFGCEEANGVWLAERVWEPGMAKILAERGINYTVLDDSHFASAGMDIERLNGYYTTEEQGYSLNIFPISQKMRYLVPFADVENTIEYFKYLVKESPNSDPVVVMADDGEKFGMWPSTYKHVYENKWLERFLTSLEENSDIVETVNFSEVLKIKKSSGRVYLSCSSYFEMSQWALPTSTQQSFENVINRCREDSEVKRFLRGGFWRNFLTKYEEANNMHKRMIYVSEKIKKYIDNKKPHIEKALDSLYAAQCNCAYWHGIFGGLYLPHLRNAVYNMLLKAENLYNKSMLKRPTWNIFDFNCDSVDEYLFESKMQNIYVSPAVGGSIFEWDIFQINHNLLNVLTRRYESYHKKLRDNINNTVIVSDNESEVQTIHVNAVKVKEINLDKFLVYDAYKRASLIDHFLANDIKHDECMFGYYEEKGDFVSGIYNACVKGAKIILKRYGKVNGKNVEIVKEISPLSNGYAVAYEIKNDSSEILDVCFAPEQVFAFSSKAEDDFGDLKSIDIWKRYDDYFKIEVELKISCKSDLFIYPVETISNSDNGYEKTYQGTVAVFLVKCVIKPKEVRKISFETIVNFK